MSNVVPGPQQAAISPRLLRSLTIVLLVTSIVFASSMLVFWFVQPGPGPLVVFTADLLIIIGALLTLFLLPRKPLELALIPLCLGLLLGVVIVGIALPPFSGLASVTPLMVMVLVALAGSRKLLLWAAGAALIAGLAITFLAPFLAIDLQAEALLPVLFVLGPVLLIGLVWLGLDRLMLARDEAVALALLRAAEAERAAAAAEQARHDAEARAEEQARLLALVQSLELPVLTVGASVLAVPLIGALDRRRIEAIRGAVLAAVDRERARTVIFDLTGIGTVDEAVAQGLVDTAEAVRLLGARPLLSGIRAPVARTLANLGVALDSLQVVGNLQEGLITAPTG